MSDRSAERKRPEPPAFAMESAELALPGVQSLEDLSPEWAFGGATGKGVRVAIVDTGIETHHPDLGGRVDGRAGAAVEMTADGARVVPGLHDDLFGHGTACAGIVHELAPEAELVSVRVLGKDLAGEAAAFCAGLDWAVEKGFDVINLSLGTTKREWALPLHEACDDAYFAGCFVVTSANNIPRTSFPSLFASVASVACNLSDDPKRFHFNPEPPTEFLARGVDVDVPWKGGGRIKTTGNSYAAAHIAGLAALVISKHGHLRPFQVKTALWATAANVLEAPDEAAGRISRSMRLRSSTSVQEV